MSHRLLPSTARTGATVPEPAPLDGLDKARAPRLAALAGRTAVRSASGRLVLLPATLRPA